MKSTNVRRYGAPAFRLERVFVKAEERLDVNVKRVPRALDLAVNPSRLLTEQFASVKACG